MSDYPTPGVLQQHVELAVARMDLAQLTYSIPPPMDLATAKRALLSIKERPPKEDA